MNWNFQFLIHSTKRCDQQRLASETESEEGVEPSFADPGVVGIDAATDDAKKDHAFMKITIFIRIFSRT